MAIGKRRTWTAGAIAAVAVAAGSVAAAGHAGAAVTCPTVSSTGVVTPAPTNNVDWAGCDLAGASLASANFYQADLDGANLSDATLTSAGFDFASMRNVDLAGADLDGAYLNYAVITGSDIGSAKLTGVSLTAITSGGLTGFPDPMPSGWLEANGYLIGPDAIVTGADLAGVNLHPGNSPLDLSGTNFAGSDLSGARMTGVNLTNGSLANTNLANADLTNATLAGVNVGGANLRGAVLHGVSSGGLTGQPTALPAHWDLVHTDNVATDGYLIGPNADLESASLVYTSMIGADLRGANLDGANLTGASLATAELDGANLTGITAQQTSFGGANLTGDELQKAYLYYANLDSANLTGADLTGATLTGASVTGTIWTGATCPDGTSPDQHAPVGCTTPLDKTPPAAKPTVTAGTRGAHGWYTSKVTVAWHWTDDGEINPAACTTSSTSSGNGKLTLTASCTDMAGNVGKASYNVDVDTTRPAVSVTGVTSGAQYVYGHVPAAGCTTTDAVSGVSVRATPKVTTTGKNGVGSFTATCTGAVSVAGDAQASPVRVSYTVVYGFGGFSTPKAGSTLKKSAATITVRFRLATAADVPIAASVAAALAKANHVRVTLRGPGIAPVTADCAWATGAKVFQCAIATPKGIKTGKTSPYTITAYENTGPGFSAAPALGSAVNPETVYFE